MPSSTPPAMPASQVLDLVAKAWDETIEDLDIVNGVVVSFKSEKEIPLKKLVVYGLPKPDGKGWMGGPIIGRGNFMPTYITGLDAETGQGEQAVVHFTTGAQAVELEVDLDTGRIDILKGVAAFDVGKAINPDMVKAQMEGGLVQGISSALFECLQAEGWRRAESQLRGLPHRHRGRCSRRDAIHHRRSPAGGWAVGGAWHRRAFHGADRPGDCQCHL